MKQIYKGGHLVERPKMIYKDGKNYIPPTDDVLIKCGYEIKEVND
jgi:hypothetical protein